ncbi:MAG TPA: hypothetical protein ENO03_05110 [Candidatus Aminicenantes bacterium]|nr:hypothetical protein [Candidatus Aminicenantes bacterium]
MTAIIVGLVLIVMALCAVIVFLVKTHREETKDLHLRLASKSLEEYHYWRDGHELEVEHNRKVLENVRDEKVKTREETPEERERRLAAKGF